MINAEDIKHLVAYLGEHYTDQEIEDMITEGDIDADGYINYEEFVKMLYSKDST